MNCAQSEACKYNTPTFFFVSAYVNENWTESTPVYVKGLSKLETLARGSGAI